MPGWKKAASRVGADDYIVARGATAAADVNGLPRDELPPAERSERPARPLTDLGNAERFVQQHGERVRYVYAWNAWLLWDGRRWGRDPGDGTARLMKQTVKAFWREAAQGRSLEERAKILAHALRSESEAGIRHALELAKSDLAIRAEALDCDPWLLNCPNGTLELQTQTLRPHRREDYLTKLAGAPYESDARIPTWDSFLAGAIPDEEARGYAQRFAGYCLTGSTREEVFVFCRGPAARARARSSKRCAGPGATTRPRPISARSSPRNRVTGPMRRSPAWRGPAS